MLSDQHRRVFVAFAATIVRSIMGLLGPVIIGRTVDDYIRNRDFRGVVISAVLLLLAYLTGLVATYVQAQQMGRVGRFVLFNLRNTLFTKLQELPLEFFNQNKAGDLISRINNDTDKLNQFFSQALVQFAANVIVMIGARRSSCSRSTCGSGWRRWRRRWRCWRSRALTAGWMKRKNLASLQALGALERRGPGEHEQLPRDPRVQPRRLLRAAVRSEANDRNYRASIAAGIANTMLLPLYGLALNVAQVVVLAVRLLT